MEFPILHEWPSAAREAVALQRALAGRVDVADRLSRPLASVAGVDVSCEKGGDWLYAAVVVLSFPGLQPLAEAVASARTAFPYVPGLLSFRELPVVLEAFRALRRVPDAILVDGQGIAHPRRFGIASHLGLWLDRPTVGCAKSRLCGTHPPPGRQRGDRVPLLLDGCEVGAVLTTRNNVRPLYVSPGHKTNIATAVELALACCVRYRLPEPTRLAHLATNRLRREANGNR